MVTAPRCRRGPLGGSSRCAAEPRAIAAYGNEGTCAVAADGKRFLVNQLGEEPTVQTPITVITNWRATLRWHGELTRLAPRRKDYSNEAVCPRSCRRRAGESARISAH